MSNNFSFANVNNFDDHINSSVRGYSDMISDVIKMSQYFIESKSRVIDIGCSTGLMLDKMEMSNRAVLDHVDYVGIESENNMIQNQVANSAVRFFNGDVRKFTEWANASLITSIFTLQFINRTARADILRQIYDALNPGGAFIFTEKVYSDSPRLQDMLTSIYYDFKRENFEDKDILDKERSLRHMLRPNSTNELLELLGEAGFTHCEPFWQSHLFRGWVCLK